MLIHLVRHAHAGSRRDWDGADETRPLTPRGIRQADLLSCQLAGDGIDTLWSSPFARCTQTLRALAEHFGLSVETLDCLAEGEAGAAALDALIGGAADGRTIVACSHGDVIPDIVSEAVRRGADLEGPRSLSKGARYELKFKDGKVTRIRHVAAPDART